MRGGEALGGRHSRGSNSLVMAGGQLAGKGALMLSLMVLSRYLRDDHFGMLLFAVALGQILLFLADLGVSLVSNREFSLHPERLQSLYSTALGLRLLTTAAAWTLVMAAGIAAGYGRTQMVILALVGAGSGLEAAAELQYAVFRAGERMVYESLARIAGGVGMLVLVLAVRAADLGPEAAAGVYAARAMLALVIGFLFLGRFGVRPRPGFGGSHLLRLLRESWPLGLMGLLFIALQRLDNVFVRELIGVEAVGAYNEPYRILESLTLLITPTLLPGALFPGLCRAFERGSGAASRRLVRIAGLVTGIAAAVMIPVFAGGMELLRAIWGEGLLRGIPPADFRATFLLLMAAIPAVFWMNYLVASVIAAGRQRTTVPVTSAGLVLSILGNLILLPRMGLPGAAVTVIAVNLFMSLAYYVVLRGRNPLPLLSGSLLPAACALPPLGLMVLTTGWPLVPRMLAPFLLYLVLWGATGGLSMLTGGEAGD